MTVHIITDSASDYAQGFDPSLTVLPMSVAFGEKVYRDGEDLTAERFYEMLVEGDELPTTGQVTPWGFSQAIEEVRRAAGAAGPSAGPAADTDAGAGDAAPDGIVIVTVSSRLSGTYQAALAAAADAGGEAAGIHVVDSLNVTVGEHELVALALRLAAAGRDAAAIASALEAAREHVRVVGLLDTLEYLRRGGRVPAAAAALGELLSIKPVVAVDDGMVVLRGKARGSKNGRNLLNREVERAGGIDFSMPVCLGYSGLSRKLLDKYVEDSARLWEGRISREDLPVVRVGATIGTHVGPGAVALAFFHA